MDNQSLRRSRFPIGVYNYFILSSELLDSFQETKVATRIRIRQIWPTFSNQTVWPVADFHGSYSMVQHLVVRGSATKWSPVLPANLFTVDTSGSAFSAAETLFWDWWLGYREISGLEFRCWARCFFSSANVLALMVTETWILIFPLSSVLYVVSVGSSANRYKILPDCYKTKIKGWNIYCKQRRRIVHYDDDERNLINCDTSKPKFSRESWKRKFQCKILLK